jgi:transcriptional regulator with XRE-family HTH domain
MDIGDRIRQIRGRRSRAEFAEELGIHPQTLYMYEKGKRVVDVELVRDLCDKFQVSVEWLIFGDRELQSLRESPGPEAPSAPPPAERVALPDAAPVIAEKDARIEELKSELIAAQAGALKAYELAMETLRQGNETSPRKNAKPAARAPAKETVRSK